MKKLLAASSLIYALPFVAFAQTDAKDTITQLVEALGGIVDLLIPIMIGLALVIFFWGLIRFVFNQGSDKAAAAKKYMLWSVIALFIMVSIMGIIGVIRTTLGVNEDSTIKAPSIN